MLNPVTTTILSFVVVVIVTCLSYQIASYFTRKGKGNFFVLINATISCALCVSILAVYVNDIYALVFQGDHGVVRDLMAYMVLIYTLHTLFVVPFLAILVYDRKGEYIFKSFKNRYTLYASLVFGLALIILLSILSGNYIGESGDPVMKLLVESEVYQFSFITYLLVFIYIIGIPTFLMYTSIGMLSNPLSHILHSTKEEYGSNIFSSGPVVQYVENEQESEPEEYITVSGSNGGGSISALRKSLITEERLPLSSTTIVIQSDFRNGWVTKLIEGHPKVHILNLLSGFYLICLISGLVFRFRYGDWSYGLLVLEGYPEDTLLDTILYLTDRYYLDYFVFVITVLFLSAVFMQGQISTGVRLFLQQYLNTSAITMLAFTFNNATAVILITSLISIMAPQYTMFGTQTATISADLSVPCSLSIAADYPVNCELSAVSSFIVAAEAQSVIFGLLEIFVSIFLIIIMFVVALWPWMSIRLNDWLPYGLSEFFETMNWTRFGQKRKEEKEVVVGDLF